MRSKIQITTFFIALIFFGCSDDHLPPVEVDFSASETTIFEGESVTFQDLSTGNPKKWQWFFEGGMPFNPTDQNPIVTYNRYGKYSVSLLASNADNEDLVMKERYINVRRIIAEYRLDNNTLDSGLNGFDGIANGALSFSDNRKADALSAASFNGTDSYVDIGKDVLTGVRTISMWFNLNIPINSNLNVWYPLITRETDFINGNQNRYEFGVGFTPIVDNEGKIRFFIYDSDGAIFKIYSNSDTWEANKWYHIVTIFDPIEGMKMYIDGTFQSDNNDFKESIMEHTDPTEIGGYGDLNDRIFNGKIDDVILYDYAVSEEEIQELLND